jgi:excisionase family DNA binding protein
MDTITFDQLPNAVTQIYDKLESIERLLQSKDSHNQPGLDELLTVQGAAAFLSISVPTIYGLISKGQIPVMKRSKRCYFSKAELIAYLKAGRKKTSSEIAAEADGYLQGKRKKG